MIRVLSLTVLMYFSGIIGCISHVDTSSQANERLMEVFPVDEINHSKIYGEVLDAYGENYGSSSLQIVNLTTPGMVKPESSVDDVSEFLRRKLSDEYRDVINDFERVNKFPSPLQSPINSNLRYSMIDHRSLPLSNDLDGTDSFKNGGIVRFSRIGSDPKRKLALVYLGYSNGPRSGWGYYSVLRKEGVEWLVTHRIMAWVS